MNTLRQIESEMAALPASLQAEVLDFVQFVKKRHGIHCVSMGYFGSQTSVDSPFFDALTEAGFIGCIETTDQLSTHYKNKIDFSDKAGTLP